MELADPLIAAVLAAGLVLAILLGLVLWLRSVATLSR